MNMSHTPGAVCSLRVFAAIAYENGINYQRLTFFLLSLKPKAFAQSVGLSVSAMDTSAHGQAE